MIFGLSKRERALYEVVIAELKEQLAWHRAHAGTPYVPQVAVPDAGEVAWDQVLEEIGLPPSASDAMHYSEDEEEILWQLKHGAITQDIAKEALDQIQAAQAVDELLIP